jgi:hypothetical protein
VGPGKQMEENDRWESETNESRRREAEQEGTLGRGTGGGVEAGRRGILSWRERRSAIKRIRRTNERKQPTRGSKEEQEGMFVIVKIRCMTWERGGSGDDSPNHDQEFVKELTKIDRLVIM